MIQIGKLFNTKPYFVRDIDSNYKDVIYLENIVTKLVSKYSIEIENIISIFSNNRDSLLHFHIVLKIDIPKENLTINYQDEDIEFTFEEYNESKTKTKNINSFMFIETFKHIDEHILVPVFDDIIGCDGKKLFISVQKENLKLFQPSSKHYHYRNVLMLKKDIISNTAESFNIDIEELYKNLNPNIIKQVCKDLNLTYKKLSFELGYKPDTINKAASTGKISDQLNKAIELYLENLRLKEELRDFDVIKQTLQNVVV